MTDKPTRTVLSHIKSNQTVGKNLIDEGFPSQSSEMAKRPTTDQIYEGEIAVNYAKDHETLSIKNKDENGNSEIVGFLSEKVVYENEKITAQAVGQLKEDTAQAVGQLKEDTESRLEMVSAQAFGKLQSEIDSNFNESQSYTNSKIESLSSDTNSKIENAELVTAAGISSILGMSYNYIHDNDTKKNQLLNLASISQRLTALEKNLNNLNTRLTQLEDKTAK